LDMLQRESKPLRAQSAISASMSDLSIIEPLPIRKEKVEELSTESPIGYRKQDTDLMLKSAAPNNSLVESVAPSTSAQASRRRFRDVPAFNLDINENQIAIDHTPAFECEWEEIKIEKKKLDKPISLKGYSTYTTLLAGPKPNRSLPTRRKARKSSAAESLDSAALYRDQQLLSRSLESLSGIRASSSRRLADSRDSSVAEYLVQRVMRPQTPLLLPSTLAEYRNYAGRGVEGERVAPHLAADDVKPHRWYAPAPLERPLPNDHLKRYLGSVMRRDMKQGINETMRLYDTSV